MSSNPIPGSPSWKVRLWCGLTLIAIGVGALLLGWSSPQRGLTRAGPVDAVDPGAHDLRDIRAHNSPSVVRSPLNSNLLAVVNRIDTPRFGCSMHVSDDDGRTWHETVLPLPAGAEPKCFAPDAAFSADGTLYVSFVTLAGVANSPDAVWLTSSSDGGQSLSTPTRLLGRYAFQVRLAADPMVPRRLYLAWLQAAEIGTLSFAQPGNPINIIRSDDGGATWTDPLRVSAPDRTRVIAPTLALNGEGQVYVAFLDLGEDSLDYAGGHEGRGGPAYGGPWRLVVARSVDGGRTWAEASVDSALVPYTRLVVFTPPAPSLVARGPNVYVAFADARLDDADVWLWASHDGGISWAPPVRVNDNPKGDGTSQYLPGLALTSRGRLDLVYYDRRGDRADVINTVSLQSSYDHGRTFSKTLSISGRGFDSRIGIGSERDMPDLGSRLAVSSTSSGAIALWSDTRAGTQASNKQDIGRARLEMPAGSARAAWSWPLRIMGTTLALMGIAVFFAPVPDLGALRRERRSRPVLLLEVAAMLFVLVILAVIAVSAASSFTRSGGP